MTLRFEPLSTQNWDAFQLLFGPRGACGGCWCMTWRLKRSMYEKMKGEGNRLAMRELCEKGMPLGVLAFDEAQPVGWCSIAPREDFIRLETTRVLKRIDNQEVWSIVCFYIHPGSRRKNLSVQMIEAATAYAQSLGARIVEAYPVDPAKRSIPDVFAFTGLASAYMRAGFTEVARYSDTRPIMRKKI